jgi:hypothetical protein
MDHTAHKLFQSLSVFDSEKLPDLDGQGQMDQRSVCVHDKRVGFLRGYVGSRAFSERDNREPEADSLTSP